MKSQEKFEKLTLLQQGYVIAEILKILHANVMTGDLRLVGESGQTGATTYGANLLGIKGFRLYAWFTNLSQVFMKKRSICSIE